MKDEAVVEARLAWARDHAVCAGDIHAVVWSSSSCACGTIQVPPRDPSIRDVLERLDAIEAKLDALSSDGSMMAP